MTIGKVIIDLRFLSIEVDCFVLILLLLKCVATQKNVINS